MPPASAVTAHRAGETISPEDDISEEGVRIDRGVRISFRTASQHRRRDRLRRKHLKGQSLRDHRLQQGSCRKTVTNDTNWDPLHCRRLLYLFQYRGGVAEIFHRQADGTFMSVFRSDQPGAYYTRCARLHARIASQPENPPDVSFAVRTSPNRLASKQVSAARRPLCQPAYVPDGFGLTAAAPVHSDPDPFLPLPARPPQALLKPHLAQASKWIWIEIKIIAMLVWSF